MSTQAAALYTGRIYPGLRPFEAEDALLFFGREEQTDELLRRETTKERFIASLDDVHRTFGVSTHSTLLGFQFEDRPGASARRHMLGVGQLAQDVERLVDAAQVGEGLLQ